MLRKWMVSALVSVTALGCASILGIEDAKLDPACVGNTSKDCLDDTSGSAGSGGDTSSDSGAGGNTGGSSGNAGSSGNGSSGADSGADAPLSLCETYCDAVMESCPVSTSNNLAVYTSKQVCLGVCATLPEGNPGDTTGNTVHCRLKAAQDILVSGEASLTCPIAGPGGQGVCGPSNCEGYCDAMLDLCSNQFASRNACINDCQGITDLGTYNSTMDGFDTVQCRLYHVSAAVTNAGLHCPHAGGMFPCTGAPPGLVDAGSD